jgi:hypothetical protein
MLLFEMLIKTLFILALVIFCTFAKARGIIEETADPGRPLVM